MSIALQWGYFGVGETGSEPPSTQGFLYFDAVTVLKKTFTGQVSKNPIDGGGNISDHFTRDNPIITFSGIISGVDISVNNRVGLEDPDGSTPTNLKPVTDALRINHDSNSLFNLIPSPIGQFFKPTSPSIVIATQSTETLKSIQSNLESLFNKDEVQLVTLYEYYQNSLKREPVKNLVMTSLVFTDSPDTGEALQCDITLEQISFAKSRRTKLSKDIQDALVAQNLKNKATSTENLGKQDSTVKEGVPPKVDRSVLKTGTGAAYDLLRGQ
jgi:hypothetical protein